MKLCRLRHELIRLPIALCVEAGLVGGVKSEAWSRGCDESQEKADGKSILGGYAPRQYASRNYFVLSSTAERLWATPSDRGGTVRNWFATSVEGSVCGAMRCAGLDNVARRKNRLR